MRILFVESDSDLRTFFGSKLKSEFKGTIDLASNVKKAIKLLKTEKPYDFIIADYQFSKCSAFELLKFQKRNSLSSLFILYTNQMPELHHIAMFPTIIERSSFENLQLQLMKLADHCA